MSKQNQAYEAVRNTGVFGKTNGLVKSTGATYNFGINNNLPNLMILYIQSSETASSCVSKIHKYIYGHGLKDKNLAKTKLGKLSANELLAQAIQQFSYFEAFSLLVKRSPDSSNKVAEIVPYEMLRKKDDGNFRFSPKYTGKQELKNTHVDLPPYQAERSAEEVLDMYEKQRKEFGKYYGEIFYYTQPKPGEYIYSLPYWFSGAEAVQADSSLSSIELEALENGFMPSVIVTTKGLAGERDEYQEDLHEQTEADQFYETLQSFMGTGNRYGALYFNFPNEEQSINVDTFDAKPTFNAIQTADQRVPRRVARAFNVPPVLIGLETPGALGDAQQRKNAIKEFEEDTEEARARIAQAFSQIWPNFSWEIKAREIIFSDNKAEGNEQ